MAARAVRQVFAIGLALALFAALGRASFLYALGAYAAALLLISTPVARDALAKLSPAQGLLLGVLLGLPGAAFALRTGSELIYAEGLHGLSENVLDRLRLSRLPAIAPPLVSADRPQTFFVSTDDAKSVTVQLGGRARPIAALPLGHGLFTVAYDPRRDGLLAPSDGVLRASLQVDGARVERELQAVTPFAHPRWFCRSPDGLLAAAPSEETDELIVVSRDGVRARIATGDGPTDCAFVSDQRVVVSHRYAGELWLCDLTTGRRGASVALSEDQARLALSPARDLLAVAIAGGNAGLQLVDTATLRPGARIALPARPDWLAFGKDRDTLLVATRRPAQLLLLRRQGEAWPIAARLPLTRPAVAFGRSSDGGSVLLAVTDFQQRAQAHFGNHFVQDQLLWVDAASLRVTRQLLTARRSPRQSKPGDVDRGTSPMGLAQAHDGAWLLAFAGSDEVWRLSVERPEPEITDLVASELHAPHGVVELADGTVLVSSPSAGAIGVLRDGRLARTLRLAPSDGVLLERNRAALQRRVGERDFFETTRAGIACQSCHQHADSDDALHNLGDHRLLPTLSVRGLLGTAPYLRDGSYPLLADLESLAHVIFRGYLRSQGGRGEALAAYIEGLPRVQPSVSAADLATRKRGFEVFRRAGCAGCHAPPAFTNLSTLTVHQLFPGEGRALARGELLDVPSLLSACATPPYLHDGRAATLQEVIGKRNGANLHGDTRALGRSEREDLLAFVCSL